jgi:cation transport ATPase
MPEDNENQEKEKRSEEKKQKHDPLSSMTGGLILILLGVLFLLATMDYLSWSSWWQFFLMGLGVILILEAIIRSVSPSYRRDVTGKLIGGSVLIFIGGSFVIGWSNWWPLILIAVGVGILLSSLWKAKNPD